MQLWTPKHLITIIPSFIVMIIIAVVLRAYLLKASEAVRLIPIKISAFFLIIIEVIKQIVSLCEGYDLYHLPFHFCSMFVFMIPLFAFCRGKWKNHIRTFTTIISATLFLFMIIAPYYLYTDEKITTAFSDFLSFHTVAFHFVAVLVFILIIALDLYKPNTKYDLKITAVYLPIYCAIGGITAQIFKTNFNNFYYCAAEPVDNLRILISEKIGAPLGQTVYILGASVVTITFSLISYFVYRLIYNAVNNSKKQENV